jgi:hypothetical protein
MREETGIMQALNRHHVRELFSALAPFVFSRGACARMKRRTTERGTLKANRIGRRIIMCLLLIAARMARLGGCSK